MIIARMFSNCKRMSSEGFKCIFPTVGTPCPQLLWIERWTSCAIRRAARRFCQTLLTGSRCFCSALRAAIDAKSGDHAPESKRLIRRSNH